MIAYRAALDVPDAVFAAVVRWIRQHRNRVDRRPWQRAASCRSQALLALRCLKDATLLDAASRDIDVSRATGYRYFHEAVDVIAEHAPNLADVLERAEVEGRSHIELDGTVIPTTRLSIRTERGNDAWYSGKHKQLGGNLEVLYDPHGFPVWISPVEPGSTHDITAARRHVFPAPNHAAATWLPVLVDLGYQGADIGYALAVNKPNLDKASKATNWFLTVLRCICERGNALLKAGWRYLRRVPCCPKRITQIARKIGDFGCFSELKVDEGMCGPDEGVRCSWKSSMTVSVKVSIVGAGVSGLAAARALRAVGLDVTVFESSEDIGGVWSNGRRYPGISLQSDKQSYAFSNAAMPSDYPMYPSGAQVRRYLQEYSDKEGLTPHIRLNTRVTSAEIRDAGGWHLELQTPSGPQAVDTDWIVVANGLNSWSHIPALPGREEFASAGGTLLAPSDLGDGDVLRGKRVVVLGYGKSAADLAVAASRIAASTDMVARTVAWKLPKLIGRIRYQHLLLTRGGEFVLWAPYRTFVGRLARVATSPIRKAALASLERRVRALLELERRDLSPEEPLTSLTHLTTEGFFEAVDDREITLHTGVSVHRLSDSEGQPTAHLSDGSTMPADVLIAATGYDQDVRLFGPRALDALLDETGDLVLDRHTIPPRLQGIAFVGWAQSFRSPLGAEVQSLWLAAHIRGLTRAIKHRQPPGRRYRLTHESAGRRGLPLVATGSGFIDLDEWIEESGFKLPTRVRFAQSIVPLDPSDYRFFLQELASRSALIEETVDATVGSAPASETTSGAGFPSEEDRGLLEQFTD